jgi:hypothetical protein
MQTKNTVEGIGIAIQILLEGHRRPVKKTTVLLPRPFALKTG